MTTSRSTVYLFVSEDKHRCRQVAPSETPTIIQQIFLRHHVVMVTHNFSPA